jgi:hypothetical protein
LAASAVASATTEPIEKPQSSVLLGLPNLPLKNEARSRVSCIPSLTAQPLSRYALPARA